MHQLTSFAAFDASMHTDQREATGLLVQFVAICDALETVYGGRGGDGDGCTLTVTKVEK